MRQQRKEVLKMSNNLFVIERARPEEAAASALMDAITKNWISEEQIQLLPDYLWEAWSHCWLDFPI